MRSWREPFGADLNHSIISSLLIFTTLGPLSAFGSPVVRTRFKALIYLKCLGVGACGALVSTSKSLAQTDKSINVKALHQRPQPPAPTRLEVATFSALLRPSSSRRDRIDGPPKTRTAQMRRPPSAIARIHKHAINQLTSKISPLWFAQFHCTRIRKMNLGYA